MYFVQQDDFSDQIISPARLRNISRKSILIISDYIIFFYCVTLYKNIYIYMYIYIYIQRHYRILHINLSISIIENKIRVCYFYIYCIARIKIIFLLIGLLSTNNVK